MSPTTSSFAWNDSLLRGTSVAALAVAELAEASRRADNPALLGSLPDHDISVEVIVSDLDAGRADR